MSILSFLLAPTASIVNIHIVRNEQFCIHNDYTFSNLTPSIVVFHIDEKAHKVS